jgi:large repetitive protein
MAFFNLRNWLTPQARRSRSARKSSSTRLRFEPLEDRACPTITIGLAPAEDTGPSNTDKYSNFTTPTLRGQTNINIPPAGLPSAISVFEGMDGGDPQLIGFGTVTGSGTDLTWSYTVSPALAPGHVYKFSVTNASLDPIEANANPDVVIDLVENAPTGLALDPASDSGVIGDGITNDNTPTITGLADPYPWHAVVPDDLATGSYNTTIALFAPSGLRIGTGIVTNAATGAWTATVTTALPNGTLPLTAKATDAAGNVSVLSSGLAITIDTTLPAVPTRPILDSSTNSSGLNITNFNKPKITGNGQAGSTVQLFDGATALSPTAVVDAFGHWSITLSAALSDGVHNLTAKASDIAGNLSAASSILPLTIDTVPPAAPTGLALALASDSGTVGDNLTNDSTPTITGTAEAGSSVALMEGLAIIGVNTATGGVWNITAEAGGFDNRLSDGSYILTARTRDAAFNLSDFAISLTITIDTTPPAAPTMLALAPGSDDGTPGDNITSVHTPTIVGSADPDSQIQVRIGGVPVGTTTADGSGAWSFDSSFLADGTYSFAAVATDVAANFSGVTASLVVNILTPGQPPPAPVGLTLAVGSDSGTLGDNLTNDSTPTITGLGMPGATIQLFDGATALSPTTTVDAGSNWSITLGAALSDGVHGLTAKASNGDGTSGASNILSMAIDTLAPAAPANMDLDPRDDSGIKGDHITRIPGPQLMGTAEAGSTVKVMEGSMVLGHVTATGGVWNTGASVLILTAGAHSLTATATDAAGNVSVLSSSLDITIDKTPPTAPTAALGPGIDDGTPGDNITSVHTPTIVGMAEPNCTVTLRLGTQRWMTTADSSGAWSFTTPWLEDGGYDFDCWATDAAGNTSFAVTTLLFSIHTPTQPPPTDTTPPTILSKQFFRLGRSLGVVALQFSEALNSASAQNVMNYWALVTGGGSKLGRPKVALYVASSHTLYLGVDLKPANTRVILAMLTPGAVTDLAGNGLAPGILGVFLVPLGH